MNVRELRARREEILGQARTLVEAAEVADRDLNTDEQRQYDQAVADADALEKRIARQEAMPEAQPPKRNQGPTHLKTGLGDSEERALANYFRTGDTGAVRDLMNVEKDDEGGQRSYKPEVELRVSNRMEKRATAEVMNVAADADGKSAVPTGFVNQIAARRAEVALMGRLGCQPVPGVGTTVNYPYENADAVVFGTASEQVDALSNTYEQDRPTLATKAFTLVKKTKKIILTEELLDDEDANVLGFIADHIGRAQGLTLNTAMLVEAAATGTSVALGAAAAATAGDPEKLAFHNTIGYYLEDGGSIAWVMRPPTYGAVLNLTGSARLYAPTAMGNGEQNILGYPVFYSSAAAAIAASAKSQYFGNWRFMGYRLDPSMRFIRDPYTTDGVVYLKYSFRIVFGQLIAGAIGYGAHPSA